VLSLPFDRTLFLAKHTAGIDGPISPSSLLIPLAPIFRFLRFFRYTFSSPNFPVPRDPTPNMALVLLCPYSSAFPIATCCNDHFLAGFYDCTLMLNSVFAQPVGQTPVHLFLACVGWILPGQVFSPHKDPPPLLNHDVFLCAPFLPHYDRRVVFFFGPFFRFFQSFLLVIPNGTKESDRFPLFPPPRPCYFRLRFMFLFSGNFFFGRLVTNPRK